MESVSVIAILPCNDLDASERFYSRLGFTRIEGRRRGEFDTYRMLSNGKGRLHLTAAVEGWLSWAEILSDSISIWKMRTSGPRNSAGTSHGVRTSVQSLILTRHCAHRLAELPS